MPDDLAPTTTPRLIALDWGTSNLRAALLGEAGAVLQARHSADGVLAVRDGRFAQALQAIAGDWIAQHGCALLASGMIGSRQGWQEVPYLPCPATVAEAALRLVTVPIGDGRELHVVPGLQCTGDSGEADVMRGEETQLWGAGTGAGTAVLPGTHSKWAEVGADGRIEGFRTYMTGELYALLTNHGILGRLMRQGHERPAAFERGVRLGLDGHADATHLVFAARTAGLFGSVEPEGLPDFLSGMLIGIELGSATRRRRPAEVTLLGGPALARRYATALSVAGIGSRLAPPDAAMHGLWRIAQAAGLAGEAA